VIFNIGDFLMRWSNDDLKSTLHRVRAPPRAQNNNIDTDPDEMVPERFSIPYPGTWSEDKPKKYSPITAGQYVDMRLNATYA
jgi:isopenicillin N synthase-like dioxygenase